MSNPQWMQWFESQSAEARHVIALNVIEWLIQKGDVHFCKGEYEHGDECLYWDDSGDDLRIPF